MNRNRELQMIEKQRRIEGQAKVERDEFQKIIETQKDEREKELQLEKERADLLRKHAEELRKQISMNEENKKELEKMKLEEGKKTKEELENHKRKLEEIKNQKLQELRGMGVKDKYTTELAKKKIVI